MSSDAFEGKYALQVGDGKQDRVQIARNLMVEGMRPGTRYRVTCAIKTLKYDRGNGLHFSALSQEGKRYKSHGGVSFAPPKEPGVWKTVSGEFTMQPGATLFRIMFDAFRGGSYLVDAVKFEEKKPDILSAMTEFADIAQQGRDALVDGRLEKIPALVNANFDLRDRIFNVAEANRAMVLTARKAGASAKFAGSGGAIVGTYEDEAQFAALTRELATIGCTTFKPTIALSDETEVASTGTWRSS